MAVCIVNRRCRVVDVKNPSIIIRFKVEALFEKYLVLENFIKFMKWSIQIQMKFKTGLTRNKQFKTWSALRNACWLKKIKNKLIIFQVK